MTVLRIGKSESNRNQSWSAQKRTMLVTKKREREKGRGRGRGARRSIFHFPRGSSQLRAVRTRCFAAQTPCTHRRWDARTRWPSSLTGEENARAYEKENVREGKETTESRPWPWPWPWPWPSCRDRPRRAATNTHREFTYDLRRTRTSRGGPRSEIRIYAFTR